MANSSLSIPEQVDKPPICELCQRPEVYLTRHHLIPRTRHRKKSARRRFSVAEMRNRVLWLCRPCHNHIHGTLSEKELADAFHTREALLAHPDIQRFVAWLREKPAGFKPISKSRRRV